MTDKIKSTFQSTTSVLKVDQDERIVWGWASVSTVDGEMIVDHHKDRITPDEMVKMADRFMLSERVALAMHDGDSIGQVIHSLPLTNELAKAFGITTNTEGWIIAMKIHSDEIWEKVKDGTLKAFSIGGRGMRHAV